MHQPPPRIIRALRDGKTVKIPKPVLVVDTREREGWAWGFERFLGWFAGIEHRALALGDYAIGGYEKRLAVERKTLDDAVKSVAPSQRREVFIGRAAALGRMRRAAIVIEGTFDELHEQCSVTAMHPNAVIGSYLALQARHRLPVIFAGGRELAEEWAAHFLTRAYVHLWLTDHRLGGHFVDGDI